MTGARTRRWGIYAGLVVLALLLPEIVNSRYYAQILVTSELWAVAVLGLYLTFGMAGQISLGHAGFVGVGAYCSGLLAVKAGVPFIWSVLAAVVLAAAIGGLVGFPALRLRGHYLAMATLGFGEIVRIVLSNWDGLTGGANGLRGLPIPDLLGFEIRELGDWIWFSSAILLAVLLVIHRLRRSSYGRVLAAIRDSEIAAECVGVRASRFKLLAFVLGAGCAGLAGALQGYFIGYISPDTYDLDLSVLFLTMLVIGGMTSPWGAIVGAVVLQFLPELLRPIQQYYLLVYGVLVLLIVTRVPGGLVGVVSDAVKLLVRGVRQRFSRPQRVGVPRPTGELE